jgi:hypothetical protein
MWVRFLKSKEDTCTWLESILLELRHLHAHHHSQSGAFAPVIKFDSDYVFEVAPTRQICARMGVGVQFSAPYAHHMLGKAERSWRTIRDNASAMLLSMAVPNFVWSCAVNIVVYLRNRTYNRSVGLSGGVFLTLLSSFAPDVSKFRVFGCTVFAKVPDGMRRKLSEKAFRGVMVSYPPNAPSYRIYNPDTRRIITSVHVVFQENTHGFDTHPSVDSVIANAFDVDDPPDMLTSHPIDTLPTPSPQVPDPPSPREAVRPSRLRSHPLRYGDLVALMAEYPPVRVTTCCDPDQGKAKEDIFELPLVPDLVTCPHHIPAGASLDAVAFLSARDCVEPKKLPRCPKMCPSPGLASRHAA